jgi:transposase
MQGLRRIDDSEARFIDTRCKTWAAQIVRLLRKQQVGRLFAAKSNTKEFLDSVTNEVAAAYLRQWPFAKSADRLASACEINGIVIEEIETGLNARRCPQCKHEHLDAQNDTFTCEICGLKRPSDQILAWNMLVDAVGAEPIQKNVATEKKMVKALKKLGETSDKEQRT